MKGNPVVKFWGCRGSAMTSGPSTQVFGGHTSCVSFEYNNKVYICDAGSGLRELGNEILARPEVNKNIIMCISHMHLDHIDGLPYFKPILNKAYKITVYGEGTQESSFQDIIHERVRPPYFPLSLGELAKAELSFCQVSSDQLIELDRDVKFTTIKLHHPGGAIGYLYSFDGCQVAYLTDHEHPIRIDNSDLVNHIKNVDLLIHDSQYSHSEIENGKLGWGHSAWEDVVTVAQKAKVKLLAMFHHDPEKSDVDLFRIQFKAQQRFANTIVAREGMMLDLKKIKNINGKRTSKTDAVWTWRNPELFGLISEFIKRREIFGLLLVRLSKPAFFNRRSNALNKLFFDEIKHRLSLCVRSGTQSRPCQDFVIQDLEREYFGIVIAKENGFNVMAMIAERILISLSAPAVSEVEKSICHVSIGGALPASDKVTASELVALATAKLDFSSDVGGNNFQIGYL